MPFTKATNFHYLQDCLSSLSDDAALPWWAYRCLLWPFGYDKKGGYGRVRHNAEAVPVHRLAYQLSHQVIVPSKSDIGWRCGSRLCFRPSHLYVVPKQFDELMGMIEPARDDDPLLPWTYYPCIEWPYTRTTHGYGMVTTDCRVARIKSVHRVAWREINGPIPDGIDVLHHCDNPPCFRPSHLHLGTHLQNMRERDIRGRRRYKLDLGQVSEIRHLCTIGTLQHDIAKEFDISVSLVSSIKRGKIWQEFKHRAPGTI